MKIQTASDHDNARFAALDQYRILDTPRERDFDDIVKLAAEISGAPISLITLIDRDRQWLKAAEGLDVSEMPLDQSICRKLMHEGDISVVRDAKADRRFDDNSLVQGEDGPRFYAGAPLETPEGVAIGMLCVLDRQPRDLTAQQGVMLKALARQVMVQLELRRALREQTRIAEELAELRTSAEDANVAKTEFLAHMSHEIRTPMNAIIGFSTILAMTEPLTAKQKEFIRTLQMSADTLLELVNDLLDIAKIEARSVELEETPFSLAQITQEVISMMAPRVHEKGLSFTTEGDSVAGLTFLGDPTRVRQIILNLCSNAIKFTNHGGIHIGISCAAGDRPGQKNIHIAVTDTGIGIAPENLDKIFDKFTQADASVNRQYGGTGLGLTITKRLSEIMGGSIEVASVPGRGSIFTVMLPLPVAAVEESETAVSNNADGDALDETPKDMILLAEDYAPNVMVASEFLSQFGYNVTVASNGIEAVEIAKSGDFALILMDVQMNSLDGLSAASFIRHWEKQNRRQPVPIIGMTAHALSGDRERCMAAGMNDYISKPFKPDELRSKIKNLIAHTAASDGVRRKFL